MNIKLIYELPRVNYKSIKLFQQARLYLEKGVTNIAFIIIDAHSYETSIDLPHSLFLKCQKCTEILITVNSILASASAVPTFVNKLFTVANSHQPKCESVTVS